MLNRLRQFDHVAYLVGGSVRDLLLGRRPKDFDIGTSAHPLRGEAAVPQLLDHRPPLPPRAREVRHQDDRGRDVPSASLERGARSARPRRRRRLAAARQAGQEAESRGRRSRAGATAHERERCIHRDNTFGTPEEDAFRRDFTVNALFYDIATFSIIDYVGGLEDLHARVIRSIGDPNVRFDEDPVRMLRAIVLAARLDFTIDPPVGRCDSRATPARLREGVAGAADRGVLQDPAVGRVGAGVPPAGGSGPARASRAGAAARSTARRCGRRSPRSTATGIGSRAMPESLTNAMLLGTLLVPQRLHGRRPMRADDRPPSRTARSRQRERAEWSDLKAR